MLESADLSPSGSAPWWRVLRWPLVVVVGGVAAGVVGGAMAWLLVAVQELAYGPGFRS